MHLDMRINGTTILTGLIGNPVAHTVSPALHNSLFSAMGINGVYLPLKVPDGCLADAVKGLKAMGFAGFNVTIPYKNDIIGLADEISDEVRLIGAANTMKIIEGRLFAFNTDADGFAQAFEEETGTDFFGKKVCILGAGGTARALSVKIAAGGANLVCIINRTEEKAAELAAHVNSIADATGKGGRALAVRAGTNEALNLLGECDIVVNTTSLGMHPDTGGCPVPREFEFRSRQIVYDVIYNPSETELLKKARVSGAIAVNGAEMLFRQGLRAFEIWTGTVVPENIVKDVSASFINYLNKWQDN